MVRLFAAVVCLSALLCQRAAGQGMLDLFPQEAVASIAIRDLDELMKKGDHFLKVSEIKVPFRPSELFKHANEFLGIKKGLDKKGSAAIILMRPEKKKDRIGLESLERLLVPVVPFTDADEMAANFGLAKGRLLPKVITTTNSNSGSIKTFAMGTDRHLYLSGWENTLKRIQQSKPVSMMFSPAQRQQFNDSDMLLHLGRYFWELESNNVARFFVDKNKPGNDPQEIEFAEQIGKSLDDIQDAVIGARVGDDGLGFHFAAAVPKESGAAKLFTSLRGTRPSSTLRGLPEGDLLLAQAFSTDERQHAFLAKGVFNFVLEDLLIQQKIIAPADRLNYLDVFHEVWRKLDGNRLAVYQTADETKLGLFSTVAILDTKDATQFLRDMKTLMKMAEASSLDFSKKEVKDEIDLERLVKDLGSNVYAVRLSASTKLALVGEPALPYLDKALAGKNLDLESARRLQHLHQRINTVAIERRKTLLGSKDTPLFLRPALTFVPRAEKRAGIPIDIVHIKLAGLEKIQNHQYRQLLGPDWDKMRLAVVGKQVVVLLGSDLGLFESALRNLQDGLPGLADSKRLAAFQKRQPKDRLFEFHVSIEGMMRLIVADGPRVRETSLTSFSLTLAPESLQLDAWLPMSEVRTIARKAEEVVP